MALCEPNSIRLNNGGARDEFARQIAVLLVTPGVVNIYVKIDGMTAFEKIKLSNKWLF